MRKFVLFLFAVLLLSPEGFAQNRQVTGTVTDESGSPVPGVTVMVQGSQSGQITRSNGEYSIQAPANGTLEFAFLGYENVIVPIEGRSVIDVVLRTSTVAIDDVVVTAMGISRSAKSLGYAAQEVKADVIAQGSNADLAGAMIGKISGVDITPSSGMPGSSSLMVIRGARSFTGNNTPLYVVDGLPINSGIDVSTYSGNTGNGGVAGSDYANRGIDIDPNDIESINVLKGQAASALYGMRASNGVVMITTKSGRGNEKGRTIVTFNTNISFDVISRLPEIQTKYAQGTQVRGGDGVYRPSYVWNSSMSWGPEIGDLPNDPTYGGNTDNAYTQASGKQSGKYYVRQRANAGLDPWVEPAVYENIKSFFDTGVTTNNSVNISKATDENLFSLTLSSSNSTGIVPNTGMDRFNAKLLAETKLSRYFTAGFSGNFVNTKIEKSTGANNGLVATIYPAPPSYDLKGIPAYYEDEPYTQNTYRATSGFDAAYWAIENNQFQERTSRFFGNGFVNFNPQIANEAHNLDIKLQLGTDAYATKYHEVYGYGHQNATGELTERLWDVMNVNGLLTANYNWTINDKLRLDVTAGSEFIQENKKELYEYGRRLNYPGWNHMGNATIYTSNEEWKRYRSVGFFGNAMLAYDNQLFLTVTGRNDVISSMPAKSRSFFYPSVALSWVFTELDALKNNVLTYGKLRASAAQVGQPGQYYAPFYAIPLYGGGFYSIPPITWPYNGMTAFQPNPRKYDPNLKPQNTNSYELGIDTYFFNTVLGLSYTYSHQNVKDQIFAIPYASSTGVSEVMRNGGQITTDTHEIGLEINPRLGRHWTWNSRFNFTMMDNRVKALADGVENIQLGGFVTPNVRASVGDKFPSVYGVTYQRNKDGLLVLDEDGYPIAGAPGILGSSQPKFTLGLNSSLTYKNVTLSATLFWKNGGYMYGGTASLLDYYGTSKQSQIDRDNGITLSGVDEDNNPVTVTHKGSVAVQGYYNAINSIEESAMYETSFLKLREVSLNYRIKAIKGLDLGVNVFARNILLWTTFPNFDPESSQGNDNMAGSFERFTLPQASSVGFGLNFKF